MLPATIFDHEGFRAWARSGDVPETLRIAFIDGDVLIEISPEAIQTHNKAKRKLTEVLGRIVDDDDLGEAYADGVLLTNEEARISTEPDLAFVTWASFESGRVHLIEKTNRDDDFIEIEGTPDLVERPRDLRGSAGLDDRDGGEVGAERPGLPATSPLATQTPWVCGSQNSIAAVTVGVVELLRPHAVSIPNTGAPGCRQRARMVEGRRQSRRPSDVAPATAAAACDTGATVAGCTKRCLAGKRSV